MSSHRTDITENEDGQTIVVCLTESITIATIPKTISDAWNEAIQVAFEHETETTEEMACTLLDREVSEAFSQQLVKLTFSCGNKYLGYGVSELEASLMALRIHPHGVTENLPGT